MDADTVKIHLVRTSVKIFPSSSFSSKKIKGGCREAIQTVF